MQAWHDLIAHEKLDDIDLVSRCGPQTVLQDEETIGSNIPPDAPPDDRARPETAV